MFTFLKKNKINFLLWIFIIGYIVYFSYFTILRYRTLYSSYYDLGIMNQTVYNSYKAIQEKDISRFLEMTNTEGPEQIKRMAIHNDLLLGLISPLYFIYAGPETLLVLQTIILGLGALAVFGIAKYVFKKLTINLTFQELLALIFSFAYLMYTPMQRANIYDFHSVTFATSFLLFMFYFWLQKKYIRSILFFILSLLTKEQLGLTTMIFGFMVLYKLFYLDSVNYFQKWTKTKLIIGISNIHKKIFHTKWQNYIYPLVIIILSIVWVYISFSYIIPFYRGGRHFALDYYGEFGNSAPSIIIGFFKNPMILGKYIFHIDTIRYFIFLLGPLAFLSFMSPMFLLIALPEFAINLLSSSWNMRNIIYHYTSVIQPFVFISAIYGTKKLLEIKQNRFNLKKIIPLVLICTVLIFQYFKGPLPFMKEQNIHPIYYPQKAAKEVTFWAGILKDDSIKISTTGQLAPIFSSRRYFYQFSKWYEKADYVVIRLEEIYNYPEKDILIPVYEKLASDNRYEKIYGSTLIEVYKKIVKI
ncbi:MAG: DUF2079 domain-containing protein [bacterium]|nr:DUF2079 domain-containing protein [bacterium]